MSIPYSVARVHGHWTVDSIENGKVNPPPFPFPFSPCPNVLSVFIPHFLARVHGHWTALKMEK